MEAHIVAQAGQMGAVTVATNMAGRGTDIKLGGNVEFRIEDELKDLPEGKERDKAIEKIKAEVEEQRQLVLATGGLCVIGTERHESRRIDNQLRGRSGRQGDPGMSKFYLCLEDDLLRIFGPDTLFSKMMNSNLADGESIGSRWLSKAIETAQKKVEARNYDIRKQVVEYDDVMNDQRKVIYEQRADIMDADALDDVVEDMRHDTINALVGDACPPGSYPEQWNLEGLREQVFDVVGIDLPVTDWQGEDGLEPQDIEQRIVEAADAKMAAKMGEDGAIWRQVEKQILLDRLDHHWKEHLATLDALRQVVFLRAYAQKQPINEYKREAFGLFEKMLEAIRLDVTRILMNSEIRMPEQVELPDLPEFLTSHIDPFTGENDASARTPGSEAMMGALGAGLAALPGGTVDPYADMGLSRNAQCPCGSGQKYKHCHGAAG